MTPKGAAKVQYKIHTLPVMWEEDTGDGDGFTVFVDVNTDERETGLLPKEIQEAALLGYEAQAQMNYEMASALQKRIEDAEYKGVDAPEIGQPYGKEARDLLRSLVKDQQLEITVYCTDPYKRKVGDIYCNGMFI